jgi:hypothetical protein
MIKNIGELNEVNKKLGLPVIKIEVKTIKTTKEYGVPQNLAKKKPKKADESPTPTSEVK